MSNHDIEKDTRWKNIIETEGQVRVVRYNAEKMLQIELFKNHWLAIIARVTHAFQLNEGLKGC